MKKQNFLTMAAVLFTVFLFIHGTARSGGAQVYQKIIKSGEVTIGISKHYPPLNFDAGRKGVDIELARELGKFLGAKVRLVPLEVTDYVPSLTNGKIDVLMAGLSRNLPRGKKIWFSEPYITLTPAVLAGKRSLPQTKYGEEFEEAPIKTLWDLERLSRFKYAVKKGSSYEDLLKQKMPGAPVVYYKTNEEGLTLLEKGKVDGLVHDSLYLQHLYNTGSKFRSQYTLLQGGNQVEKICLGLPFGDIILKNQVDIFVLELLRLGVIEVWLEKYME